MSEQNDTPDDNAILDVDPPIIQGWVSPVQPAGLAHGGVSISLAELEDPLGLRCLIDPWPDGRAVTPLAEDDRVNLYTDDSPLPVDGFTIPKGWTPQRIPLYVPKGTLRDGVNNIWVGVIRPSGNPKESIKLKVLFYRPGPTNLRLELPADVMANGIDSTRAADGVLFKVHYNARAYDTIRLLGNSAIRNRTVAPGETSPIELTLYTDFFTEVGDNPQAPFSFRAMTQLGDHEYSDVTYVDIHLNRTSLNPPKLVAPATNPIDALTYTNGVTVRVEHLPALTGDTAQLVEVNPPSGAVPFPEVPLNANKRANFTLSPEYLVQRHGEEVSVLWIYSRNGVEIGRSAVLPLQVMNILDEDKRLPAPTVPETEGTEILDVTAFTGDATVTVAPWQPWIAKGQKVSLVCYGIQENGNEFNISLLQNHSLSDAEVTTGLNRRIPRTELLQLKNNSTLRIELHAAFKNNTATIKFPQLLITIQTAALFEDFETIPLGQLIPNRPMETPSLVITTTDGFGKTSIVDSVQGCPVIPGQMHGHMLLHGQHSEVTLELKGVYSRVDFFAWSYKEGDVTNMSSYDINNRPLENIVVRERLVKKYSFTIPGIARIEINKPRSTANTTVLDHFTFTP